MKGLVDASDESCSSEDENEDTISDEAEMDVHEAGDVGLFEDQED